MGFSLTTRSAAPAARPKTHAPRFSCRPENAYRGLRVENPGRRLYSANLSRWLNRDPIEEDGGANVYAFVLNSPVVYLDANGEFVIPLPIIGVIGAAAAKALAEAAIAAAIVAAISAGIWIACNCHSEIKDHHDHHYWIVSKTLIPPTFKRCYYKHYQVRVWCARTPLLREQFPYGPCYKFPRGIPATIH